MYYDQKIHQTSIRPAELIRPSAILILGLSAPRRCALHRSSGKGSDRNYSYRNKNRRKCKTSIPPLPCFWTWDRILLWSGTPEVCPIKSCNVLPGKVQTTSNSWRKILVENTRRKYSWRKYPGYRYPLHVTLVEGHYCTKFRCSWAGRNQSPTVFWTS